MKRTGRIGVITKILSDNPGMTFSLGYFCKLLAAAKSSISEDIKIIRAAMEATELGTIETVSGSGGGVRYTPWISNEKCLQIQEKLCGQLNDPSRLMGGGFLYTSDIMFDPVSVSEMAGIFARKFKGTGATHVATIETKGIPLAFMTARFLDLPVIVVRREIKISEGPTVSINYFSGSSNRISKMSMAKKAAIPGSKALIIDDFMRAGGSLKGIYELLTEFDVQVCGIGVAIAAVNPENKKIGQYTPLLYLGDIDEPAKQISVFPNSQIF